MPVQRGITLSAALVVTGCLATPRAQDAPAPREDASQLQHDEPECARNVMVFDPGTIPSGATTRSRPSPQPVTPVRWQTASGA